MGKLEAFIRNAPLETVQRVFGLYQKLPPVIKRVLRRLLFAKSGTPPGVSCICPTYGRVDLLEEAVYSFITQDYRGPKELVILNDYARQTLTCNHPEVRIINLPGRLRSVGEKYKAAVGLCSYDMIFVWHDDDIYLPQRLSYAVNRHYEHRPGLNPRKNRSFFRADKAWVWDGQRLNGPVAGRFHGGSSWSRKQFATVRGYAHINYGYDEELESQFEKSPQSLFIDDIAPRDIYYIYRQGGAGSYQLSDFAQPGAGDEYNQVAAFVQRQAEQGEIKLGHIELKPRWHTDYAALVRDFLRTKKTGGVENA
jgi:hypothetical protein